MCEQSIITSDTSMYSFRHKLITASFQTHGFLQGNLTSRLTRDLLNRVNNAGSEHNRAPLRVYEQASDDSVGDEVRLLASTVGFLRLYVLEISKA